MTQTKAAQIKRASIDYANIPQAMKGLKRWVCWGSNTITDERQLKKPFNPRTGWGAQADNMDTWSDYATARGAVEAGSYLGLGFELGFGIAGIDLDGARDPETGAITPEAAAIIKELDSYTEVSPSGTGLHILFNGVLPEGRRRNDKIGLEMYENGRYFTVTGNHLAGTPKVLNNRTEQAAAVHLKYMPPEVEPEAYRPPEGKPAQINESDAELLDMARNSANGAQFSALYDRGDLTGYMTAGGTPDHSAADLALCNYLAYWTNGDSRRMDSLFRQSRLMRAKWNEKRGNRGTYGDMTINESLKGFRPYVATQHPSQPPENKDKQKKAVHRAGERQVDDNDTNALSTDYYDNTQSVIFQHSVQENEGIIAEKDKKNTYKAQENIQKARTDKIYWRDIGETAGGKDKVLATISNVEAVCNYLGVSLTYDVIRGKEKIDTWPDSLLRNTPTLDFDYLVTEIVSICSRCNISGFTTQIVTRYLNNMARNSWRNYPLDKLKQFIKKYPEDTGELDKLFNCLTLSHTANAAIAYTLLEKWLIQVTAMISNHRGTYGADGVLTLQGLQGIGKTSVARKLCSPFGQEYFIEGAHIDQRNDDTLFNATSGVITELGEAAQSIGQRDFMKNFITRPVDSLRVKYAVKATDFPRYTSFVATVNDLDFLTDSQNRRYWVIPLEDIDLDELDKVDYPKLWADAYRKFLTGGQKAFRLDKDEAIQAEAISQGFRKLLPEEQLLNDRLDWSAPPESWTDELTAAEIAGHLDIDKKSCVMIGRILTQKGVPKRKLNGRNVYLIPPIAGFMPKYAQNRNN